MIYAPVTPEERRRLLLDPTLSYVDIAMKVRRRVRTVARWAYAMQLGHLRSRTRTRPGVRFDPVRHPEAIQHLRRQGKTRIEIAAALGLSLTTISHVADRYRVVREPGTRPKPKPRTRRTQFSKLKEFASC